MISIRQYLFSLRNSAGLTRTLGPIDVCRDASGRPCYWAGNAAVVFKIRHAGQICALRCYTRPAHNLQAIYGQRLLTAELYIYRDATHGEWTDVVLDDWVEGETLHDRIAQADAPEFACLARSFDTLAAGLLADDCAHGDLKPENIVVRPDGVLQPIDFDASFLPAFAGQESPELGTAAFQHPARTRADFDARLDDYPAALISTALHALALDPSLRERYGVQDTLLIDPHRLPHDEAYAAILSLFERHGAAVQYRIARMLCSSSLRLPALGTLLTYAAGAPAEPSTEELELCVEKGLWGYRSVATGYTVIPALYDCGFDFTEGLAAVQLGRTWHYIDTAGRPVVSCPGFEAVKPFRRGCARGRRDGTWYEIDRMGKMRVLEY